MFANGLTESLASGKQKKNTLGAATPRVFAFIMNELPSHSWLLIVYSFFRYLVKRVLPLRAYGRLGFLRGIPLNKRILAIQNPMLAKVVTFSVLKCFRASRARAYLSRFSLNLCALCAPICSFCSVGFCRFLSKKRRHAGTLRGQDKILRHDYVVAQQENAR